MAGINSGILYLENFVDSVNNLPADVQRMLGYIQCLDKRFDELKSSIEVKVRQWVEAFQNWPKPLPQEAHEQRMVIDEIHAEMIHMQEEKYVFAQQIENTIRDKVEDLNLIAEQLENDIAVNTPIDAGTPTGVGAVGRSDCGRGASFLGDDLGLALQNSMASIDTIGHHAPQSQRLGIIQKKTSVRVARKCPNSTTPQSMSSHLAHANSFMVHQQKNAASLMVAPTISNNALAPVHMADPQMPPHMTVMVYFQPLIPGLLPYSSNLQAAGRILKVHEIGVELIGKQAELLWPDDRKWYLIKITKVNMQTKEADILYITGETEDGIALVDVATKSEMSMIIPPTRLGYM